MKKLLILFSFLLSFFISFSQNPKIDRTSGANTVNDPRGMHTINFFMPTYNDTISANVQKGIDSCGAQIFTRFDNSIWKRDCNPKRWTKQLDMKDTLSVLSTKWYADKLQFSIGIQKVGNDVTAQTTSPLWNANKLQSINVSTATPLDTFVLTYNAAAARWEAQPPRGGGGGGGGSDGNNFPSNLTFNINNGIITLERTGLANLTVDLDGRWLSLADSATMLNPYFRKADTVSLSNRISISDSANAIGVRNVSDLKAGTYHSIVTKKKNSNDKIVVRLLGFWDAGDGGGGLLWWDESSTETDNNGTIFQVTGVTTGRWKRVIDEGVINVLWFGARRYFTQATQAFATMVDATSAFQAAIDAAENMNMHSAGLIWGKGKVVFPRGVYRINGTLYINTPINFEGLGAGMRDFAESQLWYPTGNTSGIIIRMKANGTAARETVLMNFYMRNYGSETDTLKHGISTNAKFFAQNVYVDNFGGNGWDIVTNDSGNANNSTMLNCYGNSNNKNGIFFSGNESNNIGVYSSDFTSNRRCGILDRSFLGNMYYNTHCSANGFLPIATQQTWVQHGGKLYATKVQNNQGHEPGVGDWENYWWLDELITTLLLADAPAWSSGNTYFLGSGAAVIGDVNQCNFYGCYIEGGEAPVVLNTLSTWWGGDVGTGFAGPNMTYLSTQFGRFQVQSGGVTVRDKDSTLTYVNISNAFGLEIKSEKSTHGGIQIKYFEDTRTVDIFGANDRTRKVMSFTTQSITPTAYGRSTLSNYAYPQMFNGKGIMFGDTTGKYREFAFSPSAPLTGEYGTGDFRLNNNGDDLSILGWRRKSDGSWGIVYTGNYAVSVDSIFAERPIRIRHGTRDTLYMTPVSPTDSGWVTPAKNNYWDGKANPEDFVPITGGTYTGPIIFEGGMFNTGLDQDRIVIVGASGELTVSDDLQFDLAVGRMTFGNNITGIDTKIGNYEGGGSGIWFGEDVPDGFNASFFKLGSETRLNATGGSLILSLDGGGTVSGQFSNNAGGAVLQIGSSEGYPTAYIGVDATAAYSGFWIAPAGTTLTSSNGALINYPSSPDKGLWVNDILDSSVVIGTGGVMKARVAKGIGLTIADILHETTDVDKFLVSNGGQLKYRTGSELAADIGAAGISDGDKTDITVSASGATWTIDPNVVTFAKMQAITDGRLLGASGGTAVEEITIGTGLSLASNTLTSTGPSVLWDGYTDANNGTTVETDLFTYTTAASRLAAGGEKLTAEYGGTFNDATSTVTIKVYFAGTVIYNSGALALSATGAFDVKVLIIRSGSTTARAVVTFATPTASSVPYAIQTDITGVTFTNTNIIKITGQAGGATGGSNDITGKLGTVIWYGGGPG